MSTLRQINFFALLKQTIQLDILQVNYLWCSFPAIREQSKFYSKRGILAELAKFLFRLLRGIYYQLRFKNKTCAEHPILFYTDSITQYRVLAPLKDRVSEGTFWIDSKDLPGELCFPAGFARFIGLLFLPVFICRLLRSDFPRWTLPYSFAENLDGYGYYFWGVLELQKIKPRALVLANDHCSQTRGLLYAAKALGIPTVYLQHAAVTKDFPALDFDFALLDGMDSLQKYAVKNKQCKIYLVGMSGRPKPKLTPLREHQTGLKVGIGFNISDKENTVIHLLDECIREMPQSVFVLRPHPSDTLRFSFFKNACETRGIQYSNAVTESVWDFLEKLDFLIAGHSSIHLDAAHMNVIPLQHFSLTNRYDHYGFFAAGLTQLIHSVDEIPALAANETTIRENIRKGLKTRDSTYQTAYDGKSADLAASVIENQILGRANPYFAAFGPVSEGLYFDVSV